MAEARGLTAQRLEALQRRELARVFASAMMPTSALPRSRGGGTRKGRISFEETAIASSSRSRARTPQRLRYAHRGRGRRGGRQEGRHRSLRSAARSALQSRRIVFEARTRSSRRAPPGRAQRVHGASADATYGVLVVAGDEQVPSGSRAAHGVRGQQDHRVRRPRRPGRSARAAARLSSRRRAGHRWLGVATSRSTRPRSARVLPRRRSRRSSRRKRIRKSLTGDHQ